MTQSQLYNSALVGHTKARIMTIIKSGSVVTAHIIRPDETAITKLQAIFAPSKLVIVEVE